MNNSQRKIMNTAKNLKVEVHAKVNQINILNLS